MLALDHCLARDRITLTITLCLRLQFELQFCMGLANDLSKQFTTSEIAAKSGIAHRDGNEVWVLCVAEIDYDNQEQTVSLFIGPCAAIDGRFDDINKQAAAICEKDPAAGRSIWRCFHDRSG